VFFIQVILISPRHPEFILGSPGVHIQFVPGDAETSSA
jgi:hypothetical protein